MGHAKAINRTEVAQGATNVRSQVIPISALVKATNRSPRRERSTYRRQLFIRSAAITTAWIIGLAWGAFT